MAELTRHELNAHHGGTEFIECAEVSEIPDEGVIAVNVAGQPIALAKSDGKIFAVDNRCGITLSRGACTDGTRTPTDSEPCTPLTPRRRFVRGQPR